MVKLEFSIDINASAEKVFKVITEKETAAAWISVFSPNSFYEGSWDEGQKITFITPDEHGKLNGMVCRITKNIPGKELYIQPLGNYLDGKEIIDEETLKSLAVTYENYHFIQHYGYSEFKVYATALDEFESFFNETWPVALKLIKEMAEKA